MIKPRAIRQLPQCTRCRFYCDNPYLMCEIFPDGPEGNSCIYFAPESPPLGQSYYNGELIKQELQRWTVDEKLAMIDYHPLFTGVCPECDYCFPMYDKLPSRWVCPDCGWCDEDKLK